MRSQSLPAAILVLLMAAVPVAANLVIEGVPAFGQSRRAAPAGPVRVAVEWDLISATTPVHPPVPPAVTPAAARPSAARAAGAWARLRACESGGNYRANTSNGYYGAYQFSLSTWRSLGYSGYPHHASPAVQDEAARRLQARSGWRQWPACSRRLGLR